MHDDEYFESFNLRLPEKLPNHKNKFKGLNYSTLGDYKTQFDLRPIRNVVVKQNSPTDDDSSMYEVFNRLNTGGINLRPQEIRTSMYHSEFYEMLYHVNSSIAWRRLLRSDEPDLHMKDIEILLRGFAMLVDSSTYAPSMVKFLNRFSRKCESHTSEQNKYLETVFQTFLQACAALPDDAFLNKKNKRFNIALYEAVFTAAGEKAFAERRGLTGDIKAERISSLENDDDFLKASLEGTTRTANVDKRLERARLLIGAL